jgi:hypothetical protein
MQVRFLFLGLAALAVGCGSSGGSTVISSQPLAGKIGGQAWTFMTGETDSYLSTASEAWVAGYAETFTACTGFPPTGTNQLLMRFPMAVGSYAVTLSRSQTFYIAATNDNLVATSGEIDITEVTATTISGGANFAFNADNSVDGQFQVTICP